MARKVRYLSDVSTNADGTTLATFAVWHAHRAAILCVRVEADRTTVSAGSLLMPASAMRMPLEDVRALVPLSHLAMWECRALGLYKERPHVLIDTIVGFADANAVAPVPVTAPQAGRFAHLEETYGLPPVTLDCLSGFAAARPKAIPAADGTAPEPYPIFADRLPPRIEMWAAELAGTVDGPTGLGFLSPQAWTGTVSEWFSEPGDTGERRRQAGRLQGGFAPVLAIDKNISAAIDAGVPFEALLLAVVRGWLPPGMRGSLDLARLRRLRGIDYAGVGRMASLLALSVELPMHLLPAPGEAPRNLAWIATEIENVLSLMGLPLAPLIVSPVPGWFAAQGPGQSRYEKLRGKLVVAFDVVTSLSRDLVQPLLGAEVGTRACERIAGRLLFSGMRLSRLLEASDSWHADLPRINEAAAHERPDLRWPALFEPFDCGNGITITCLTSTAELVDEGWRGPDVTTGMHGLDHCVGGYAMDCASGDIHVVSLRGGGRRLSTATFLKAPHRRRLLVGEHFGLRNTEPNQDCVNALRRFDLAHRKGDVRIDPSALEPRDEIPLPPPSSPEALAMVHAAWRPHFPRGREGIDAFREVLLRLLDEDSAASLAEAA